jgi:putative membrane protein
MEFTLAYLGDVAEFVNSNVTIVAAPARAQQRRAGSPRSQFGISYQDANCQEANWRYARAGEATLHGGSDGLLDILAFSISPQGIDMRIPSVLKTLLGIVGAAALLGTAHGQATAPPAQQPAATTSSATGSLSKADQKFVMDIARGNLAEIEIAKLALSKSQNDQVKTFAQQMIDDHTKAQAEVEKLASAKGVTMPSEPDKKHKALLDKLSALSGDAFDKAYWAQAGIADHKKMHSLLASAQAKAKDPDVKALAAKLMPTVDQHLKAAQQISSAKGTSKNAKPSASTAAGK